MKTVVRVLALFACLVSGLSLLAANDAYVESTEATLYMNTGYRVGPKTRVELDFQMTEVVNQSRLLGMSGPFEGVAELQNGFEIYIGADGQDRQLLSYATVDASGARQAANVFLADTDRHTVVLGFAGGQTKFRVLTDGAVVVNRTLAGGLYDAVSSYPLGLFGKNYTAHGLHPVSGKTTYLYPTKMKVFGFKIYEDDVLVRNFQPCLKGGVAGLKDACTGRFFTGDDIKAATAGGDVPEEMDDPYVATPENWIDAAAKKSLYFDTGHVVNPNTRFELDYALLTPDWSANDVYKATDANAHPFVFSAAGASQNFALWLHGGDKTKGYCSAQIGTGSVDIPELRLDTAYGVRRTVVMDKGSVAVITSGFTNLVMTVAAGKEVTATMSSNPLKIAMRYNQTRFAPIRIYGARIYEGGTLVKNFVPGCTNGVPYLKDTLNGDAKIYPTTYKGGDGQPGRKVAAAGGDIADDASSRDAYLEFSGKVGTGLNTGYVFTKDTCAEIDLSLWHTSYTNLYNANYSQPFFFEQRGWNSTAAKCNGVWARLYVSGTKYAYMCRDYPSSFTGTVLVPIANERRQIKLDAYNGRVTVACGDDVLYDQAMTGTRTATTCTTNVWIGSNWSGTLNAPTMRLYGFKIWEAGVLQRQYVPYRDGAEAGLYDLKTGQKLPLAEGKVSGGVLAGTGSEFAVALPATAKIEIQGTDSLTCLCPCAQSYEWYRDGVKIPGATGPSLTLSWATDRKPHTSVFSVRPVYELFCNPVKGASSQAAVTFDKSGLAIFLR